MDADHDVCQTCITPYGDIHRATIARDLKNALGNNVKLFFQTKRKTWHELKTNEQTLKDATYDTVTDTDGYALIYFQKNNSFKDNAFVASGRT